MTARSGKAGPNGATLRITAEQARRLLLARQRLARPARHRPSVDQLVSEIERLGFVQIDSIQTVARAHHMVLFSRSDGYEPELLQAALEHEARLFEGWTHDASIIPTRFYPYWRVRFRRERPRLAARFARWHGEHYRAELDAALARIRTDGPVLARAMRGRGVDKPRGWWDWHAGKAALEFLWQTGELAVARREGFQKVYDLADRVIPARDFDEPAATDEAYVDWACRGALERLGIATPGEIAGFWDLVSIAEARAWIERAGTSEIIPVNVEAADGGPLRKAYAAADIEDRLDVTPPPPGRVRVLSPFDPVLRDRRRVKRLFDFDYRIEIFVPAPKRTYGYYVFPLLEGDRLVGRIDMKADRKAGALVVSGLWMEPGVKLGAGRLRRLEAELDRHRRFIGVDTVRFEPDYLRRG